MVKPTFYTFIEKIADDDGLEEEEIITTFKNRPPIRFNSSALYAANSLKTLEVDLIRKYYNNFQFEKLQMIIVASSGVSEVNYNSVLAMVAEYDFTEIPFAVQNLANDINSSFNLQRNPPAFGSIEADVNYDFTCQRLMDRVLFINVCLSSNFSSDQSLANVAISIKFINEILKYKEELEERIAVLDFRMTMHTHVSNFNINIFQDRRASARDTPFYQTDSHFEIVNPRNYHLYKRFGNPGREHYRKEADSQVYIQMLGHIQRQGYPIRELYQNMEENIESDSSSDSSSDSQSDSQTMEEDFERDSPFDSQSDDSSDLSNDIPSGLSNDNPSDLSNDNPSDFSRDSPRNFSSDSPSGLSSYSPFDSQNDHDDKSDSESEKQSASSNEFTGSPIKRLKIIDDDDDEAWLKLNIWNI